jgi:site-specific recombinase XerD
MKTILSTSDCEKLLQRFGEHLLNTQGLAERTCASRAFYVREFLRARLRAGRGELKLPALTSEVLLLYVLERGGHNSPGRLQALASALRSFCRFLQARGYIEQDLTSALPRIASPGRSTLPDYLRPEQLETLLGSFDPKTLAGRRDYAILLCLARLGLRAGEVAQLRLEQIDWRAGVLRLSAGKGRRERELPLPAEVGRAIAHYLRRRSPQVGSPWLFSGLRSGGSLTSMAISQVSTRALKRAGVQTARPGAHLLRRTLASHLVQQGVSLKAVADLLGHRSLNTTRIYASVNHAMLLTVARPWPMEVPR